MFDDVSGISQAKQTGFLIRPRIRALLAEAIQNPLSLVCAGAGYGKTQAVRDFVRSAAIPCAWLQLSEYDNAGSRFWAKYVQLAGEQSRTFAEQCSAIGFPDTEDKLNRYAMLRKHYIPGKRHLSVLDDAHLIHDPDILRFLERWLRESEEYLSVIVIGRELPALNLVAQQVRGLVPSIGEDDLCFTEGELARYLSEQGLKVPQQSLRSIYEDTNGWAFAVNLVASSLR